ncbi:SpoIIE family protein phosphatase [Streptomyces sp. NPDC096193]|uniref:SpoIIE family protein phosphatase n=1 Tax=Streptomyces sp. NPDC096193 TaxID=3155821 RepID=UPI00331A5C7E
MGGPTEPRPFGREWGDALLEALFTESPMGLYLFDEDLRLIRMNSAARGWRGAAVEDHTGHRLGEVVPGFDTEAIEAMLRRVLDTGQAAIDFEQRGFPPTDPTREYVASISAFRLRGSGDAAHRIGVAAEVTDVTGQFRARNRVMLLNAAGERVGRTLDMTGTAEEFVEFVVPALADAATVDLFDCVLRGGEPPAGPVESHLPLRRVARRDVESTGSDGDQDGSIPLISLDPPTPYTQSVVDHRPRLIQQPGVDPGVPATGGREAADGESGSGTGSVLVLPLVTRGVALGVAVVRRNTLSDPFDEDDLAIAAEVAGRMSLSLDNARRYEREHATARTLQRGLLPPALPSVSAVETAHRYLPGLDAGGDWFDLLTLSGGRVALVVGDVEGHGLAAATTMGQLRTAVFTLAALDLQPEEVLSRLDDMMARMAEERTRLSADVASDPPGASCVYLVYDPVSRLCTFARAGHPPAVLVRPDGQTQVLDGGAGPPLGLGGLPFEAEDKELPEGSLLALYTNGLIEGRRASDDALGRLQRVLAHPGRSLADSCDEAVSAVRPRRADDDAVLLLARTRSLTSDSVATWTLPLDPAIVSTARTLAGRQLAAWDLDDLAFTTELMVSELVTNAIRYSTGTVVLRLIRDGDSLLCEVFDNSTTAPHLRRSRESDEGGRGLLLVAQCSRRWGTRLTATGKAVWAEQPLPEPVSVGRLSQRPADPGSSVPSGQEPPA